MNKLMYRPVGLAAGVAAGAVANMAFRKLWPALTGHTDVPDPADRRYGWGEVLIAATVQGAIFGLVQAAVNRTGAVGIRHLTSS
ncbi:MAG: DUF4235 domain-containing protein [Longispora sp.]|nr:DUF4235 domain-containing protein [Longispora sp. (in: high G+C Gram-positive bacteria)]